MSETFATLQSLFTTAFVVTSMLVIGSSLTIGQIEQLQIGLILMSAAHGGA